MFTNYGFIGFLLVLIVLYYVLPKRMQAPLLLCASILFYSSAGWEYLPYILFTAFTVWLFSTVIDKNNKTCRDYIKQHKEKMTAEERKDYKRKSLSVNKRLFLIALLLNLGILAVVKYTTFFLDNMNQLIGRFGFRGISSYPELIVPLGISFYTFQSVGYLIDVYREDTGAEKNFFKYLLFVMFFPQLIQGPISRFNDLSPTLFCEHSFDIESFWKGLERILWGYFKKLVIADRVLIAVNILTADPDKFRGGYAALFMLFYMIELYADFTGGIDITIGIAQILGITVKENFVRPYLSVSLAEYWRRWHISMYTWFRDYVFYPLSTSSFIIGLSKYTKKRFGRNAGGKITVYLSSLIVWLCTGIWHGANWNFVIWGLLNFLVLSVSNELKPVYERFHREYQWSNGFAYKSFMIVRTFLLLCVINFFDCLIPVRKTVGLILSVFDTGLYGKALNAELSDLMLDIKDYFVLAVGCSVVVAVSVSEEITGLSIYDTIKKSGRFTPYVICFVLFISTVVFGVYGIGYDPAEFIYNRF